MNSSLLFQQVARLRRRWFERRPHLRRRLGRPVISVGNLAFGGSGKTPVVACLARLLMELGERPAVLSRGYRRLDPVDGVVIVRDHAGVRAGLEQSGDEPLMLAHSLAGALVLVAPDRYLAGRLAETHLGATVHLLDDGFQHLAIARDVDIVVIDPLELRQPIPLRESVDATAAADAVLIAGSEPDLEEAAPRIRAPRAFRAARSLGTPRLIEPYGQPLPVQPGTPVLAVAAVARPDRFFEDLERARFSVKHVIRYRDHHQFSRPDIDRIARAADEAGAEIVLTTEKDMVRLMPLCPMPLPVAWVPLDVAIEPRDAFIDWIRRALEGARAGLESQ